MAGIVKKTFLESLIGLEQFIADQKNFEKIEEAGRIMAECLVRGGKIISCGNGGSMSDAMHFAEELSGRFRNNRIGLAAIAISDPSYISCVANDFGYKFVFSRFTEAIGNAEDVLLAISTSGNSENVVMAAQSARNKGMKVVGLTGKNGGELSLLCDAEIRAPHSEYADRAQEIHIIVIHSLIEFIESELNISKSK